MNPDRQEFPLRERKSPPLPWRSRQACARWARAFTGSKFETMASGSNHAMRPYAGESKKTTSMALFQFGCQRPVYSLCNFLSVESLCDIELHVGQGSNQEAFLFFLVYYTWTREPAPVQGRHRALLSTCQPSLLPVLQGRSFRLSFRSSSAADIVLQVVVFLRGEMNTHFVPIE